MADGTTIEWTHRPGTKGETWNPIRARHLATGKLGWHCETVSDGCKFCYAAAQNLNRRNLAFGTGLPYKPGHRRDIEIFLDERTLTAPLRWRDPRTIFVCSMTDAFGSFLTDAMLDRIFAVAALCPEHVFIFVTKRAARMREYVTRMKAAWEAETCEFADRWGSAAAEVSGSPCAAGTIEERDFPLSNVWLIVSTEDQETANERVPELLATPAAVRGVSAEPLLGPIDFKRIMLSGVITPLDAFRSEGYTDITLGQYAGRRIFHGVKYGCGRGLDWVIVGGESGPNARPMHPDWARSLRDQCAAACVPFFFKQWGEWGPGANFAADVSARKVYRGEIQTLQIAGSRDIKLCIPTRDDDALGLPLTLERYGKKFAGRMLDGSDHSAFPEAAA